MSKPKHRKLHLRLCGRGCESSKGLTPASRHAWGIFRCNYWHRPALHRNHQQPSLKRGLHGEAAPMDDEKGHSQTNQEHAHTSARDPLNQQKKAIARNMQLTDTWMQMQVLQSTDTCISHPCRTAKAPNETYRASNAPKKERRQERGTSAYSPKYKHMCPSHRY